MTDKTDRPEFSLTVAGLDIKLDIVDACFAYAKRIRKSPDELTADESDAAVRLAAACALLGCDADLFPPLLPREVIQVRSLIPVVRQIREAREGFAQSHRSMIQFSKDYMKKHEELHEMLIGSLSEIAKLKEEIRSRFLDDDNSGEEWK